MAADYKTITNLRGPAARITDVSATSVAAGEPAEVVMTGPDQNRKFVFKVPRGLPGASDVPTDPAVAAILSATDSESRGVLDSAVVDIINGTEIRKTWLLLHAGPPAAQSNVAGRGTPYSAITDPANSMIFQIGFKDRTIRPATEPLDMNEASTAGIGPMLQFARQMVARGLNGGNPILIIPAARGGTRIAQSTAPTWRASVSGSLWDDWKNIRQDAINAIEAMGHAWTDYAAISIHGESDGDANVSGPDYQTDHDANIVATRAIVGLQMPILIGGMVPEYLGSGTRRAINGVHASAPNRHTNVFFIPPPTNSNKGDGNHFNRAGSIKIAETMADAFSKVNAGLPWFTPEPPIPSGAVGDYFNRADSTTDMGTASNGQAWTSLDTGSVWGIAQEAAYLVSDSNVAAGSNPVVAVQTGIANGSVQAVFADESATTLSRLIFRAVDGGNYLFVQHRPTTGKYQLYKSVAGVFSQIGADSEVVGADGDTIRVVLSGTSVDVRVNGISQITATVTEFATATKHGFGMNQVNSNVRFDSFLATPA